ncbi:MAG TPA: hypothetical protein PLP27_06480 [Crocinitomicaceae bacterium]|nr:hypothetical protein [Crocinitomicaceae bacterium]
MRGQQSLFTELFTGQQTVSKQTKRPRNFYLPERNNALLHRYYFHAEINRYRYDDCLAMLEKEFYLTIPRIVVVLSEQATRLSEVVQQRPTISSMKKMFPHFNWSAR